MRIPIYELMTNWMSLTYGVNIAREIKRQNQYHRR